MHNDASPPSSPASSRSSLDDDSNSVSIPLYHRHGNVRHLDSPASSRFAVNTPAWLTSFESLDPRRRRLAYISLLVALSVCAFAARFVWSSERHEPPSGQISFQNVSDVDNRKLWDTRAAQVKDAFVHAYGGYVQFALPKDELLPLSNNGTNDFNGWGVTIVDSLDTILLMDLGSQYYSRALEVVQSLNLLHATQNLGFFETVIRYMGGFLSAYAMTNEDVFKERADQLGQLLLPVFNTISGLPASGLHASSSTPHQSAGDLVSLAEMASFQMEYKYLAHITGRKIYYEKAQLVNKVLARQQNAATGLISDLFSTDNGLPRGSHFSVGARSDSAYEYLLKQYLLTAQSEPETLQLYLKAATGIIKNLLYLSPHRNLLFVTDISFTTPSYKLEHLSCFISGFLALGAISLSLSSSDKQLHLWAAEGLAETCYVTYVDQASGLSPDIATFEYRSSKWYDAYTRWESRGSRDTPPGVAGANLTAAHTNRDYQNTVPNYLLRPETVESLFVMYRATGQEIWRERAWQIFEAIEAHTKTSSGYASVHSINQANPKQIDSMPSYYTAETLKYLYLLFQGNLSLVSLDQWVLNTEAHPFPIFHWSQEERTRFSINS